MIEKNKINATEQPPEQSLPMKQSKNFPSCDSTYRLFPPELSKFHSPIYLRLALLLKPVTCEAMIH